MDHITLKAYAKLNLSLNILPERGGGDYYRVQFLNIQVSLYDSVSIRKLKRKTILINEPTIDGKENIAYKAAKLMFDTFNLTDGFSIKISKCIPARAGLGGGSSDAAAVMNGLSVLFGLSLKEDERIHLAKKIGMDVCYCITGGLRRIGGIGDAVHRLPCRMPVLRLLIATPHVKKPSTGWAYSKIDVMKTGKYVKKLENLIKGIEKQDLKEISRNIHNDFEEPIQRHYPITKYLKEGMIKYGALNAMLAGSGLSVFGIFKGDKDIFRAKAVVERNDAACCIVHTVDDRVKDSLN
ncbi:MAG: 4-(cytidine 5'-diphospho)-2-C-methyl-D-erythritol kinase [Spirochaetes bacterium]|nr:4-(cytidine 5'-diphospho)-2-C-methyl-D-erythritol kinase [Spirochaetota bacterium]